MEVIEDDHPENVQKNTASLEPKEIAAAKPAILTTHAIKADETLSDLSLKYYGHATPPYWRLIYEANKEAIGPNPNHVHPGTVLNIPILPETMKK